VRSTYRDTVEGEERDLIEVLRLTGRIILKMIFPDPCSQSPVPFMGDLTKLIWLGIGKNGGLL
jgi:hypothetical protein